MDSAKTPKCRRPGRVLVFGLLSVVGIQGCGTVAEGVMPEGGTPVVTRVQGPGGGDVLLTSELSIGTFQLGFPPEQVWIALPNVFEEMGIEITYENPGARATGNNQFRARRILGERNSRYLDCGYGSTATPYADSYEVTASLVASVRPGDAGDTVLETLFTASARAREVSGGNISCSSKGILERRMVEMLTSMLGGSPSGGV